MAQLEPLVKLLEKQMEPFKREELEELPLPLEPEERQEVWQLQSPPFPLEKRPELRELPEQVWQLFEQPWLRHQLGESPPSELEKWQVPLALQLPLFQ